MTLHTDNLPNASTGSMLDALRRDWTANGWDPADLAQFRMDGEGGSGEGGSGSGGAGGEGGAGAGSGAGAGGSGGAGGGNEPEKKFTQDDVTRMLAAEKEQGRRSAVNDVATQLGCTVDEAKKLLDAHREAEKGKMTEAERMQAEAAEAKSLADRTQAEAAETKRTGRIERALIRAKVADESLDYAVRMVLPDVALDATDEQLATAVDNAKKAVPALFAESAGGGGGKGGNGNGKPKPADGDPGGAPPRRKDGEDPFDKRFQEAAARAGAPAKA